MKWTTNRPTKQGRYWLSIHPDKRPSAQRSDVVFPAVVPFILYGGGQGSYREGGSMLDLSDPWFDNAQWAPREPPADPFAKQEGGDADGTDNDRRVARAESSTDDPRTRRDVDRGEVTAPPVGQAGGVLPPWRAELERLRGMVRERQCLAGEELQRLTKLEELDALRSGVVGRNTHLLIPNEVAECMRIRGGGHHPSGHWTLDTEFGEWECEDPTGYTARSEYILTAIDAAGAAVLAGEG